MATDRVEGRKRTTKDVQCDVIESKGGEEEYILEETRRRKATTTTR